MDAVIEVVAAEGIALMTSPKVKAHKVIAEVVTLISVVTTSILRSLISQGSTSRSAISPDYITFEGGLAVA
jgi:hypothetical protein